MGLTQPGWLIARTVGTEEQNRSTGETLDERGKILFRCLVDPVQVLHHKDDWLLLTPCEIHLSEDCKGRGLHSLWVEHSELFRSFLHPQKAQEIWCPLLRVHLHLLEAGMHF